MKNHAFYDALSHALSHAFFPIARNLDRVPFLQTPKSMADGNSENDAWTNLSPRIIFVRLSKDKSKDAVEDEIFKYINKVVDESNDSEGELEKAKNCITLPDFGTSRILQVAVGPEFLGFLFNDGRVCRVKCVTKNVDCTKKLYNSQDNSEEPIFQVKSDEAYARHLQNQLNEAITSRSVPGRSLVLGGGATFRPSDRTGLGNGFLSNRTRHRVATPWMANRSSTVNSIPTQVDHETQTTRGEELEKSNNTRSTPAGDSGSSSSHETNTEKSTHSSNSDKSIDRDEGSTVGAKPSTSDNTKQDNKEKIGNSKPKVQDKSKQKQENPTGSLPANNTSSHSSSAGSNPRRSVSSPTLLHRTVFTTNVPGVVRPWSPFGLPVVGSVSQFPPYISRGNQIFRASVPLQAHVVRAQLAEAGAFPRGPTTANFQRSEDRSSSESKTTSCSDADFCYPEIGDLEWLEVENVSEVALS